jgi:hypothetical protein
MLRSPATTDPRKNTTHEALDNPKPVADATGVRRFAMRQHHAQPKNASEFASLRPRTGHQQYCLFALKHSCAVHILCRIDEPWSHRTRIVQQKKCGLSISDRQMPGMNGVELFRLRRVTDHGYLGRAMRSRH